MSKAIYRTQGEWEEHRRHVRQDAIERHRKKCEEWGDAWESYKYSAQYTTGETRPWSKAEIRKSDEERNIRIAESEGYQKGCCEGYFLAVKNLAPDQLQLLQHVLNCFYDDTCPIGISNLRKQIEAKGDTEPDPEEYLRIGGSRTSWQWVARGFVPKDDANWHSGIGPGYYYCGQEDVVWDPARADELLKTGPREFSRLPDGHAYDGRPWWLPCQESDEKRWAALAWAKEEAWG